MNPDDLNEVATLLHITSEIVQNHPNLGGIARACNRRLAEINADLVAEERKQVEANKQEAAKRAAANFKAPKPGEPGYIEPEKAPVEAKILDKPIDKLPDPNASVGSSPSVDPNANVEVERRV